MKGPRDWTLEQKLALVALVLGAGALFATTTRGSRIALHRAELARIVARGEDHVSAPTLGSWIIEGRSDYRLVDVRDAAAFAAYHIPGAENLPLTELIRGSLPRNEKLVLYGDGEAHATQAWMLLVADGYAGVTTLSGGIDAWRSEVLHPLAPSSDAPEEQARFERAASVARHFGGAPRMRDAAAASPDAVPFAEPTPSVEATPVAVPPAPSASPAAPVAPKKKKEGC